MISIPTAECEQSFTGMNLHSLPWCSLLQVDHLLTLLVITLVGLPLSKLSADECAKVVMRKGLLQERKVQEGTVMLSNDALNVWSYSISDR
jgi:hypothetical protein